MAWKSVKSRLSSHSSTYIASWDLSRLGRNYIETGKLLERFFPFMGVRFIAINDSYDSQTHNAQTDSLIIPFKNLINDAYCADTSRKIRSQFDIKRKKGDYIGSFAAFGYLKDPNNKNRIIIDECTAPVVRDIFNWKIQGMSQQGIANRLNELGIPSPLEYKKTNGSNFTTTFNTHHKAKWTPVAVGRILKNDLYIGVLTQGITTTPNYKVKQRMKKSEDEWVRIEQSHEPIISKEDYAVVAALLKKDTRIAPGEDSVYLFSGMLYCADCGQNLVRKYMYDRGNKYLYYVCSTHKKGNDCKSHLISDKALYAAVFESLRFHINECARISRVLEFIENMPLHRIETEKLQKQIADKQAEIDKLNIRSVKLYEDFKDEVITKDEYKSFKEVFAAQAKDANNALENLEKELDRILNNQGEGCLWIENFKKYQGIESLTRSAVVELIECITVYEGGKINPCFRYQVNFEDVIRYVESLSENNCENEKVVG